jgi:hypothetical protein
VLLGDWAFRYLFTDFFVPVWPNIAASAVLYVMVRIEHMKTRNEIRGNGNGDYSNHTS